MLGSPRPSLVDADQELIHLRVGCVESRRLSDFMLAEAEMAPHHAAIVGQSNCALPRSPGITLIVSELGGRRASCGATKGQNTFSKRCHIAFGLAEHHGKEGGVEEHANEAWCKGRQPGRLDRCLRGSIST